jgi:chromosomal replication initiator protein
MVVSTNNSFAKMWVERHYFSDIKDAIFNTAGIDYGFRIALLESEDSSKTVYQREQRGTGSETSNSPDAHTAVSLDSSSSAAGSPIMTEASSLESPIASSSVASTTYSSPSPSSAILPLSGSDSLPEQTIEQLFDKPRTNASSEVFEQRTTLVTDERTFESFIVGDSNRYAFSAALGVAKSPGNIYNPLFIYGESGLGKTHLLLAIENYIKSHHPHLKTTYAQTSDLVRDFTAMLYDEQKKREFERKYHHVDVVLFDDVQSLEGKIETTSEVFQIFNHFKAQDKQIVLSADRAPKDINLDTRYKSRFASGITIDIQPPTFETKQAIFENYFDYCCRKIGRSDIKEIITRETAERIIELSTDNIRELEGATASLVAYLSARKNMFDTLTIEEVEQRISSVFMRSEEKRVDIGSIQKAVEVFYKISHEDLLGKKRSQGISYPRQIAMYLSRSMTSESFPDIGRAFGGKDHSTVMYACNNIEQKRQLSGETDREIERLVAALKK